MRILKVLIAFSLCHIVGVFTVIILFRVIPNSYAFGLGYPVEFLYPVMAPIGPLLGIAGTFIFWRSKTESSRARRMWLIASVALVFAHLGKWLYDFS